MKTAKTFNELLRKLNCDPVARERFFDEYYDNIRAHAYCKYGEYSDWEDIVQDVVRKLLETDWTSYSFVKYPATWLNTIADNRAKDLFRRSNRVLISDSEFLDGFDINNTLMEIDIREELKQIPKNTQYIIYAQYKEVYSYLEISEQLGESYSNVRVKAHRALKNLKLKL